MHPHLRLRTAPLAEPANMYAGPDFRITVLTPGLLRLEFDLSGRFEDRASQFAVDRSFAPCEFEVDDAGDWIELYTERLHLTYNRRAFSAEGLSVRVKGKFHSNGGLWHYGRPTWNLGGTARTLDEVDGACPLEPGILSRGGITAVDDSATMLLTDDGWIAPRRPQTSDVYVFAYGHDYREALRALYTLAGPQPLLPRFALGNWWSRYHPYTAEEYLGLMDRFGGEDVPLTVAVIDMDWHLVDIDPRFGSGWTGYTWNTELFPDPPRFLAALHERGLAVSLNVHPAEGVHAHEAAYPVLARRLGLDPARELAIAFDPSDPEFMAAYLDELHHPLEDEGVDFWWLDWQQGAVSRLPGLDPLWLLNHLHFLDSARNGRRPITFSRYAGLGSHRYPVGFSGDTVVSWASLDFQPYFTATASNTGYGWWSHDIGGHMFGAKDDELATRWVQLGVFSPVTRLHSSDGIFNTKEPWRFGELAEQIMKRFLRLRHQLLPYLWTMNVRAHAESAPLVAPMYYDHPEQPQAYEVANQYLFGTELLVAPITAPADPVTETGSVLAWLPDGEWIDFFTGRTYRGGRSLRLHRGAESIPVLARAGAIIPMMAAEAVAFGVAAPAAIELRVFAGADGDFTLVEDADDERWARTRFQFDAVSGRLRVHPVSGEVGSVPAVRRYEVVLCGFERVDGVQIGGRDTDTDTEPGPVPGSVRFTLPEVRAGDGADIRLRGALGVAGNDEHAQIFALLDQAQMSNVVKHRAWAAVARSGASFADVIAEITALDLPGELAGAMIEILTARPLGLSPERLGSAR